MRIVFEHTSAEESQHDLAAPVSLVGNGADFAGQPVVLLKAVGGLTKLEHVAAIVASNIDDSTVENVVDYAQALLAECAKRQAKTAERSGMLEGVQ